MRKTAKLKSTVSDLRITALYAKVFNDYPVSILELPGIWKEARRRIDNGADDAELEQVMIIIREKIKQKEISK